MTPATACGIPITSSPWSRTVTRASAFVPTPGTGFASGLKPVECLRILKGHIVTSPVALVSLEYSGESVDEAIAGFTAKLASAPPGATCTGWNWEAKIDPEAIR